ncbi:phospholipase-like protein, partial [Tanacetum coccineum]
EYHVTLTCRSRLTLIRDIRDKIRNTPREESFRNTCFGWLLDLDQSQENSILVHHISCRQVESEVGDTKIVPFTYLVGGFQIQFGREEFCLVTGLRFGVDFNLQFLVGSIPFRRRVFESGRDGKHITAGMLLEKINNKEFDSMNNDDAVGLCLLGILELVLLGNANVERWEAHFAIDRQSDNGRPKYSLMGFIWAIKGAQPSARLTPDAVVAQAEWWLASKAFFNGHIREQQRIPPPVNQHSHDDVLEYIYRRMVEQDNLLKGFTQPMPSRYSPRFHPLRTLLPLGHNKDLLRGLLPIRPQLTPHPNMVFLPIHAGGDHWVMGAINLPHSTFYVLYSLHSHNRNSSLSQYISEWTEVLNDILEELGQFKRTRRRPYNFYYLYNEGLFSIPQQTNYMDCGVVTCWLINQLCMDVTPVVRGHPDAFFNAIRVEMTFKLYQCWCEDTAECGYD